jgi:hypothetical protein
MISKPFSALLWKETMEVWRVALPLGLIFGFMLFGRATQLATDRSNPAIEYGAYGALSMLAMAIGFMQTQRESRADMRAFALHRPASGAQIFGAKIVIGIGAFAISIIVAYALALSLAPLLTGNHIGFQRSDWLGGIGDWLTAVIFYAGGLYAGSHPRNGATRFLGIFAAFIAGAVIAVVPNLAITFAIGVMLGAAVIAAAWLNFMKGPDFEAQPLWDRIAHSLVLPVLSLPRRDR